MLEVVVAATGNAGKERVVVCDRYGYRSYLRPTTRDHFPPRYRTTTRSPTAFSRRQWEHHVTPSRPFHLSRRRRPLAPPPPMRAGQGHREYPLFACQPSFAREWRLPCMRRLTGGAVQRLHRPHAARGALRVAGCGGGSVGGGGGAAEHDPVRLKRGRRAR